MLRAIREIPAEDIYGEIVRAARVTAGPGDWDGRLSPSSLAIKKGKETVDFVREIAAVYASWILSKPYPRSSLEPGDVERMANFESFLQFKVQFLNRLIPFEGRRTHFDSHNPTPTPTLNLNGALFRSKMVVETGEMGCPQGSRPEANGVRVFYIWVISSG